MEDEDVRAVKGGTGMAKTGGNYAASLRAGDRAEAKGYTQVLWLDGVHRIAAAWRQMPGGYLAAVCCIAPALSGALGSAGSCGARSESNHARCDFAAFPSCLCDRV